jgi:GT2 family glycosyltransferase
MSASTWETLLKKQATLRRLLKDQDWPGVQSRVLSYFGRGNRLARSLVSSPRPDAADDGSASLSAAKQRFQNEAARDLIEFLASGSKLSLPCDPQPELVVFLVLFNKAELTFQCLKSLAIRTAGLPKVQIHIFDNGSSDLTATLLSKVSGAVVRSHSENIGYLKACNLGLQKEFVPQSARAFLLLNNDTIVHAGAIESAYALLFSSKDFGSVGGRIELLDGTLQEAGNVIWNDGTCKGFGRGAPPTSPEALVQRATDYCSGVFLMTRSDLWYQVGGYDPRFVPAYYEDADYCVELQKRGLEVVYHPLVRVTHFEYGSAGASEKAFALMNSNRIKFLQKHKEFLSTKPHPRSEVFPFALDLPRNRKSRRVLFLEDYLPHQYLGAGFPRSAAIVRALVELGHKVTIYALFRRPEVWAELVQEFPLTVEIHWLHGREGFLEFLRERSGCFDICWVCRPHNMELLHDAFDRKVIERTSLAHLGVVFDSEALFSEREKLEVQIRGSSTQPVSRRIPELDLAKYADHIVSVSQREADIWRGQVGDKVTVIGHETKLISLGPSFDQRNGILFVGSLHAHPSPNSDALLWFCENALMELKTIIGPSVRIKCVGYSALSNYGPFAPFLESLEFVGKVDDLAPFFHEARLMIVPTRYAAGIPQKTFDAAAYGLPTVCSPLIVEQMGWQSGSQCLEASIQDGVAYAKACARLYQDEVLWNSLRVGLVEFLERECPAGDVSAAVNSVIARFGRVIEGATT